MISIFSLKRIVEIFKAFGRKIRNFVYYAENLTKNCEQKRKQQVDNYSKLLLHKTKFYKHINIRYKECVLKFGDFSLILFKGVFPNFLLSLHLLKAFPVIQSMSFSPSLCN